MAFGRLDEGDDKVRAIPELRPSGASAKAVPLESCDESMASTYGTVKLNRYATADTKAWRGPCFVVAAIVAIIVILVLGHAVNKDARPLLRERRPSDTLFALVEVSNVTVAMPGLRCDEADRALVFYPVDLETRSYPLLVFAPGDFEFVDGWNVKTRYVPLLEGIARRGYVVVSPLAAGGWCVQEGIDQRHVMNYVRTNGTDEWLWRFVDFSRGAGVLGVSMGGLSSIVNAIDARDDFDVDIAAAVAISPFWDGFHEMQDGMPRFPIKHVNRPLLFITGTKDNESPWWFIKAIYNSMPVGVPTALAIMPNYTHHTIRLSPGVALVASLWFDCAMQQRERACAVLDGDFHLSDVPAEADEAMAELEKSWYDAKLAAAPRRHGPTPFVSTWADWGSYRWTSWDTYWTERFSGAPRYR